MEKAEKVEYKIDMDSKIKTFHANMIKLYVERVSDIDVEEYDDGDETLIDSSRGA